MEFNLGNLLGFSPVRQATNTAGNVVSFVSNLLRRGGRGQQQTEPDLPPGGGFAAITPTGKSGFGALLEEAERETATTDLGGTTRETGEQQENFMDFYPGWDPEVARQDFMATFGGDIEALKEARGVSGEPKSSEEIIQEALEEQEAEFARRAERFEEENPFSFDEALARQSAEERFNPFYEQTLSDYLQGVRLRTERSVEDRDTILQELTQETTDFTGKEKRLTDLAIERAREGQARSGTFFSGQRLRQEGLLGVESAETLDEFLRKQDLRGKLARRETARELEDIGLERRRKEREVGRFENGEFVPGRLPEFDILQEVEDQRRESKQQREFERLEFLGRAPGETLGEFETRRAGLLGNLV